MLSPCSVRSHQPSLTGRASLAHRSPPRLLSGVLASLGRAASPLLHALRTCHARATRAACIARPACSSLRPSPLPLLAPLGASPAACPSLRSGRPICVLAPLAASCCSRFARQLSSPAARSTSIAPACRLACHSLRSPLTAPVCCSLRSLSHQHLTCWFCSPASLASTAPARSPRAPDKSARA